MRDQGTEGGGQLGGLVLAPLGKLGLGLEVGDGHVEVP
jgi:hypothetical protein